jgi:hypothetical protein
VGRALEQKNRQPKSPRDSTEFEVSAVFCDVTLAGLMAQIWRLWWRIAVLGLFSLAVATHVTTRTPSMAKPAPESVKPSEYPVICPFAPPCWRNGEPIVGAR